MTVSLLDLSKLTNHASAFADAAKACGFSSLGDIDRFLFTSYGKAVRELPPANRPRGAIFLLKPGASAALAKTADLIPVLMQIRTDVACKFYMVPFDLSGGATVVYEPTSAQKTLMTSGAWPLGHALTLSRDTGCCVVWANGVSATVCLDGYCYIESPDVVEAFPTGLPTSFEALSWDDGAIVHEFASHELNDTSPAGVWQLPGQVLLRPRPEKLMSVGLGKFLRYRMAGYRHHDDEPYVENQGRADVSLVLYNGFVYIIEVKWVGRSLTATRELETEQAIKTALQQNTKSWFTEYDDGAFVAGAKQLAQYFGTGKYQRAYLVVFDCRQPASTRKSGSLLIDHAHFAPHSPADFRVLRACVDPRKASVSSKAKKP